jgi:hypothetical protein
MKLGWRKLQGNRKRQSTWFDITTGQHFAEVLPSSSTICYITNVSTENLLREARRPRSTSLTNPYSDSYNARRSFSAASSVCPVLGQQGLPLQVGDIRYVSKDETPPPINFSPSSIYSQSSFPQGLCKPISPLKLKPKVLNDEHPTLIPSQSTETGDPFQPGTSSVTPVRVSTGRACVMSGSQIDSIQSSGYHDGKMHADRTSTVNPNSSWHFPSPSVTACIIRNSIYHHQSPPSKRRNKPPTTADSDSPAFEYDETSPTAIRKHVVSGKEENPSSVEIGGIRDKLATAYVPPAGLETAALSTRRSAPRIRRRTSHNDLSTREAASSWLSDGRTLEVAQHLLDPKEELPPISMQAMYDMTVPLAYHPAILTNHSFF